ncbi:MAG: hypothetical protein JWO09_1144 [Bacteroidetes bacterium]|nr:hypothetical protein [Bacteroidota bacterium]
MGKVTTGRYQLMGLRKKNFLSPVFISLKLEHFFIT